MRYPWVCLSVIGVWAATVAVATAQIVEPTKIYIYATATALTIFFLGFVRD